MKELLNTGVNLPLTYDEGADALMGQVRGYSAAVRENLETASYGCLFWIKEGATPIQTAENYLIEKQKAQPELIKKFRVTETGAAVALNRTGDDFMNVNNLKRFLFDFAKALSDNGYINCCCECGTTENLGIYTADGGVIAQVCSSCGVSYTYHSEVEAPARVIPPVQPAAPIIEKPAEEIKPVIETATEENKLSEEAELLMPVTEEKQDTDELILTEIKSEEAAEEVPAVNTEKTDLQDEFSALLAGNEDEKPVASWGKEYEEEAPVPVITETNLQEEFSGLLAEEEKPSAWTAEEPVIKTETVKTSMQEEFSEFLAAEGDAEAEDLSEPVIAETSATAEQVDRLMFVETEVTEPDWGDVAKEEPKPQRTTEEAIAELNSLMVNGEEVKQEAEKPRSKIFEEAEREFAEEQARLAENNKDKAPENAIDDLLINADGDIEIKKEEEIIDDGSSDVTEYRDTTDYGDDFDIDEIESTVTKATVTTGHPQLTAEETPLEEDGSVPLINPNSHREERQVSAVDGPDAVQPLEFSAPNIMHENLASSEHEHLSHRDDMSAPNPYDPSSDYGSMVKKVKFHSSSNPLMGIVGAVLFGIIGVVIWTILGSVLNVISTWGSIAIVFTVYWGYTIGGGAMDKKGAVISFLLSLAMTVAGILAVDTIAVKQAVEATYMTEATISDSFMWIVSSLGDPTFIDEFFGDFAIAIIFTLIIDVSMLISSLRKS